MGIDATMFVRTRTKVTEDDVRSWSYELASAFGPDQFWIEREGDRKHHCLEIVDEWLQDGPSILPEEGETFIQVHVTSRFYGPGYERGDLPMLIAIAEWLEARIPHSRVWYGGDSSGVLAEPFGPRERRRLFRHFVREGRSHREWLVAQLREMSPDMVPERVPFCDFCGVPMTQKSFTSHEEGSFECDGCGYALCTTDGGATYRPLKQHPSADGS